MRLIDADAVTTDSVSFGRIGDFEIQVHRDRGKELADNGRFRPTSKLAYATRKARGSAGQKLLLNKVRFWLRNADITKTSASANAGSSGAS
jgi:hypothetical protein